MLRNRNSPYEIDKRSYHLQKYKKFIDSEYKIVDAAVTQLKERETTKGR